MELHSLISSLARGRVELNLSPTDLAFLIILQHRAEDRMLASFDEDLLYDTYIQACEVTEAGVLNPRTRATHAIARLRDQRLLGRVDGAGMLSDGEYTLSQLATAIVSFFKQEQTLTRESLSHLTGILRSQLSAIKTDALSARSAEDWRLKVMQPLRLSVADLVTGIERRQRGLDGQQEAIRQEIGELLRHDWFQSVESCERLLAESTATLRELNEVLIHEGALLQGLLQDIEHTAAEAGMYEAAEAARRVSDQVSRMSAWGADRQRAWSDYFQFVQRYLRTVVRLDPGRALSQRLRDQIIGWSSNPFFLCQATDGLLRTMREVKSRVLRAPVARPAEERERALEFEEAHEHEDVNLLGRVGQARREGAASLARVLTVVLPQLAPEERFRATGRIAAIVAEDAIPPIEREWLAILDELKVEEWPLR